MNFLNQFILHDSRELEFVIPQDPPCISTTITSPPYWKLKDYGVDRQIGYGQTKQAYLADLETVFKKTHQRTKSDGSLWIVVDDYREDGILQLLPWEVAQCAQAAGWILRDIIIWDKQHTLPWHMKGQMRNVVEYILFFSKSDDYKFYVDRIKDWADLSYWWVDFPERFNPKGKTPTNIWSIPIRTQGTWRRLSEMNHHCPFPIELVARIIELTTDPDDLVFDPFGGSGVVLAQAAAMKRNFFGCDVNRQFIEMFSNHIKVEVAEEWKEMCKVKEALKKEKIEFEQLIMQLRALKYTRQSTKPFLEIAKKRSALAPKAIICSASIPRTYERKNPFGLDVYVVVNERNADVEQALQRAIDRTSKKPLSLYEIHSTLQVITLEDLHADVELIGRRFYLYPDYKPRKHVGVKPLRKWLENDTLAKSAIKPKVPMLANIAVDVSWVVD